MHDVKLSADGFFISHLDVQQNKVILVFYNLFSFLSVKKWLLRKRQQVELARKRGWKGYWVCLKGTTLLFYPCEHRDGRAIDTTPKHLIIVDGAIMQPIPEHPKRDFIFCLSTAFGDAYLFQVIELPLLMGKQNILQYQLLNLNQVEIKLLNCWRMVDHLN